MYIKICAIRDRQFPITNCVSATTGLLVNTRVAVDRTEEIILYYFFKDIIQ